MRKRFGQPSCFRILSCTIEELRRPRLHVEPCVLMRLGARDRGDALHEIEDALRPSALFIQYCVDDLRGLRFREAALAQETAAIVVGVRDDLRNLPARMDELLRVCHREAARLR